MHVVIFEPSKLGQKVLSGYLSGNGNTVDCFDTTSLALDYIRQNNAVKIVLVSVDSRDTDGLELVWKCRLLEAEGRRLYVIAMSSGKMGDCAIEALDCGADDFIRTPPIRQELYARLRVAARLLAYQKDVSFYAARDPLTGLMNRYAFTKRMKSIFDDSPAEQPSSFLVADIDHFKTINDTYGHPAGDQVIRTVARVLDDQKQLAGRIGGEEFALMLHAVEIQQAITLAEVIRQEVERRVIEFGKDRIRATISIGVTEIAPEERHHLDTVNQRADEALYAAKRGGRNQLQIALGPTGRGDAFSIRAG